MQDFSSYGSDSQANSADANPKKLYIGNLSFSTTEESLKEAFSQAGPVASAIVITDKYSGRSKGFGFVEFEDEESAQKAIEMWNEKELDGRPLRVNVARPKRPRDDAPRY